MVRPSNYTLSTRNEKSPINGLTIMSGFFVGQGNFVSALVCRQAYEREAAAIEKWKNANNIRTRSRKCRLKTQFAGDGYLAGQRAGDKIGLHRQVKSSNGQMLSLKNPTA
jgi:hypothetical protein